jgi:hypothetical protein
MIMEHFLDAGVAGRGQVVKVHEMNGKAHRRIADYYTYL